MKMKSKSYSSLLAIAGISLLFLVYASLATATEGKININSATVKELRQLKGIGKTIAERIVAYREDVAPFKEIGDIKKVKGVGKATFAKIEDQITVEDEKVEVMKE